LFGKKTSKKAAFSLKEKMSRSWVRRPYATQPHVILLFLLKWKWNPFELQSFKTKIANCLHKFHYAKL